MSDRPESTARLQQWMQSVITHHAGVQAGVESDEARAALENGLEPLEAIVLRSKSQSSLERLEVYGNAYYARLLHCLRDLFPACRHAAGDESLDAFAFSYLQYHPPQSYTLGNLATHFVAFLEQSRTEHFASEANDQGDPENQVESWSRFLVELARLEHVIDEVFDGPGIENDPPIIGKQLKEVAPEVWPELRLTPVVCLRLLEFEFPVNDYYTAFRRSESPSLPEQCPTYLAVNRRDYVVRRYPLDATQYDLLTQLVDGATIGEALTAVSAGVEDAEALAGSVSSWFAAWAREQFFARLDL